MALTLNGTTGIQNVLGSAAAPAESNTTSSNTGMYFPTSTTLGFSTAGTNAVTIDASQNVGIGTATPQEKLEVKTATSTQILVGAGSGFTYGIGRETTFGYLRFYGNQTTAIGYIFTGADGERMRIDSSGSLLVGATASAGSITNTAPVVSGVFKTLSGTVSAASATATTIATLPSLTNGTYIVSCAISAASPTNYSAVSIVSVDSTVLRVTSLQTAGFMSITISGQTVQATQSSGISQTIYFTLTRVS